MSRNKNTIYIGRKPIMVYVMAVMHAFKDNPDEVIIKARGRSISVAVDVAEVTRNSYLDNLTHKISIGTEKMEREEGGNRNVSTIEIILRKQK